MQTEALKTLDDDLIENVPYNRECLIQGKTRVWIGVSRADGFKCERCWNFSPLVGSFQEHLTLCRRCYNVVNVQQSPAVAMVGCHSN